MNHLSDEWLDERFARSGARCSRTDFEVAATCHVTVTDDPAAEYAKLKPAAALYMGGMGAPEMNFRAEVYRRMGYEQVVADVGRLFMSGRKEEAVAAVPDELIAETAIIGNVEHVRAETRRWEVAGVTSLVVDCRDVASVRALGEALATQ